jgi:hypothetical protein
MDHLDLRYWGREDSRVVTSETGYDILWIYVVVFGQSLFLSEQLSNQSLSTRHDLDLVSLDVTEESRIIIQPCHLVCIPICLNYLLVPDTLGPPRL